MGDTVSGEIEWCWVQAERVDKFLLVNNHILVAACGRHRQLHGTYDHINKSPGMGAAESKIICPFHYLY